MKNTKNVLISWSEAEMQDAKDIELQGNLSLNSSCALFRVPYLSLQRRVTVTRMRFHLESDARTRCVEFESKLYTISTVQNMVPRKKIFICKKILIMQVDLPLTEISLPFFHKFAI